MDCIELPIPPLPQFVTVGHAAWQPGDRHFERSFPVYDLLIVVRGCLYMTEDDRPYAITPGRLLLLEPGRTHFGHLPCEEETEIYWVHFYHPEPAAPIAGQHIPWSSIMQTGTDRDHRPRRQRLYLPKWTATDLKPLLPTLQGMVEIQGRMNAENALRMHSTFARLLELLQQVARRPAEADRSLQLSRELESYLARCVREPYRSDVLERDFHFNAEYLSRCLKKHTGKTPVQYIRYLRMEEARRLLASTGLPVPEIAASVGLSDYNYFIRLFRQTTGLTPRDYRRANQGLT